MNYPKNTVIKDKKLYTIVEERSGWGKLKSGAWWISLKYTKKAQKKSPRKRAFFILKTFSDRAA